VVKQNANLNRKIDRLEPEEIKEMLSRKEGIKNLCRAYFYDDQGGDLELTDYQAEIIQTLVTKKPKRNLLWATTRAGKSFALAIGAILTAMLRPGEKIKVVGPTTQHSKIIMNYILDHVSDDEDIVRSLTAGTGKKKAKKLREELSKSRITLENNSEIEILSASVNSGGRQLLGKGGSIVIVDEAEQIPDEIVRTRILRMIGDRPEAQMFLISNPTFPDKRGFMWEVKDRQDETREQIKETDDREEIEELRSKLTWNERVISWEKAVEAGRMTKEFVEEEKRNLTTAEFKILYEAIYPENVEGGLVRADWYREARRKDFQFSEDADKFYGLDIAEEGDDLSVLVEMRSEEVDGRRIYEVTNIWDWDEGDTSTQVKKIQSLCDKESRINVDGIGVGKNVADTLADQGWSIETVKVSRNPTSDKDRFRDQKAQFYWELRECLEDGLISLPDNSELRSQVLSMQYEFSGRKELIKIGDPASSPDHADALMLCLLRNQSTGVKSVSNPWAV